MGLRTTALHDRHTALGAKLADFNGWSMPIEYGSTIAEHEAVRAGVGVFDVSHLGTVFVDGPGAQDVVAASFTNDPAGVGDRSSQYTLCCDEAGGIVDDLIAYRLGPVDVDEPRWMLVPNAGNTAEVVARLETVASTRDAAVHDHSADRAILAVQGPDALALAADVLPVDPAGLDHLALATFDPSALDHGATGDGGRPAVVCRTGYTGEPGCEVVVPNAVAGALWDALLEGGAAPVGLGARDTLRLEMGYALHGNDLDTRTNPYEARLGWAVKLDREDGGGFVGREALVGAKARGVSRRLMGLRADSRRPPRAGMDVFVGDEPVGRVTSGSYGPTAGVGIGLAYLDRVLEPGSDVEVDVRGRRVPFVVQRPPFVERSPKG